MSDYRRYHEGRILFFTVVTYRREPFLTTEPARSALREAIRTVQGARPFSILATVLLPDHLHTIWELPEDNTDFSIRWSHIKSEFTKRWLASDGGEGDLTTSRRRRGERGVWQRRFYDHVCRSETELKRWADYLHVNPLKHGLVERVVDWPWSSFHRHVKAGEYPANWGSAAEWYGDEFRDAD